MSFRDRKAGHKPEMGENFPEGTSASDPSAVPRRDRENLNETPPRVRDEDDLTREAEPLSGEADEEPENQQAG